MEIKKIKTNKLYRSMSFERADVDEEKRTVSLSFSSEAPVERYFGKEILSHKTGHADMSFISSGRAPLIKDHYGSQIGVVDSAEIKSGKGRAVVRFSKRAEADAEFQDVLDGIRTNVSVGYRIRKLQLEKEDEKEGPTYRAVDWVPLEISLVDVPADMSVGVGRSEQEQFDTEIIGKRSETIETKENIPMEKTAEEVRQEIEKEYQKKSREEIETARNEAVNDVREIVAIGDAHGMSDDANRFINEGKSARQFKDFVLEKMAERGNTPVDTDPDIGLNDKETRQFSFLRAIRALAHPGNRAFQEDAKFEFECSKAVEDRSKRTAKGLFVPTDVLRAPMQRDMNTQVDTAGGYLVDNVLAAGSFIETLENSLVCRKLGAIMLRDLVGDMSIPKQTGGATAYWITEGDDITESAPTFGQVVLRPMGVGAYVDLTRKMMLQSSMDVENLVRNDMALRLALAIDLAGLSGTGAAGEPMGILNTTGIGSVSINAQNAPDWGDIIDLETAVSVDNALTGSLAYTANATIQGNMKQTVRHATASVNFILEGNTLNGYPFYMSNQVTSKYMIFGNWRDLVLGFWSGVDINVDTSSLSTSGGTRIVAIQDCDVAVRHAESFASGYHA